MWLFSNNIALKYIVVLVTSVLEAVALDFGIIGGHEAEPHSMPYQVALLEPVPLCGGALISATFILTAAHCLRNRTYIDVKLGAHNMMIDSGCEVDQEVDEENFIIHPDFNSNDGSPKNDIALLRLDQPVQFNRCVQPIDLPRRRDRDMLYVGEIARASGWGDINDAGAKPNVLRYVDLTVTDQNVCRMTFDNLNASQLCTSGVNVVGVCNGDSGGPLAYEEAHGTRILIGIASIAYDRCEAGRPSIFSRITSFLDWIAENSDVHIRP